MYFKGSNPRGGGPRTPINKSPEIVSILSDVLKGRHNRDRSRETSRALTRRNCNYFYCILQKGDSRTSSIPASFLPFGLNLAARFCVPISPQVICRFWSVSCLTFQLPINIIYSTDGFFHSVIGIGNRFRFSVFKTASPF